MPYEHKVNTGSLFAQKKEKETSPDFSGTANIGGKKYRLVGWKNRLQDGTVRLNLRFDEGDGRRGDEH